MISSKELIEAVKQSDYENAKQLLDIKKVNINSKDFSDSPIKKPSGLNKDTKKKGNNPRMPLEQTSLHIACNKVDIPMAKLLIERGADVNSKDKDEMTPLYYAILRKSTELCDYLLANGAELEHRECMNRTPLYWTSSLGESDMLEYLIKKGANVNATSKLGRSALSKACWNGQISIVERLAKCHDVIFSKGLD